MTIIKTYFGFKIKNYWPADIHIYKLFSKNEFDIAFAGEIVGKIKTNPLKPSENKIQIICSRNMNIPESDIIEIGVKVIELINSLN